MKNKVHSIKNISKYKLQSQTCMKILNLREAGPNSRKCLQTKNKKTDSYLTSLIENKLHNITIDSIPILQLEFAPLRNPIADPLGLHKFLITLFERHKRFLLEYPSEHLHVLVLYFLDLLPPNSYVQRSASVHSL